jgi:transcriptional regulator with XRE-family HTH domain/tetratricopeptide (TPR) repeat protein
LWLRRKREAARLTQEELAGRAGMSVRAISDLERGIRKPYPRSLRLVASALGLPETTASELIAWYRASQDGSSGLLRQSGPGDSAGSRLTPRDAGQGQTGSRPEMVPRQLPGAVARFAGRIAELAVLDRWLEYPSENRVGAVVISAIGGMAGVGKTALALHWAHRVAGRFPDGQLYVNLRGYDPSGQPALPAEVIRTFLGALGVAPERIPADSDGQTGMYRSLLAGRRMLIVADNARDAAQARPLLPGAPGCLVLVTSRSPLTGLAAADGACVLTLDVPTETEAAELLAARLGADRVAAEPEAVAAIIRLCGRLPLALAVVAARAAASGWPLAGLAAELADARARLGALSVNDPTSDVQAVFSWSYAQLSAGAARVFRLLSIHPGPDISAPAAGSLAGLLPSQARAALRELVGVSLITERVPGRYALHDLLRDYAEDRARAGEASTEGRAALHRMLDHYLHAAGAAARALDPVPDLPDLGPPQHGVTPERIADGHHALAWLGAEHKVLLAVIRLAVDHGFVDHARQLPWTLVTFQDRGGHWHELIASHLAALACAERLGDVAGQARTHRNLGRAQLQLDQTGRARAHLTQAASLSRSLGDRAAEARALLGLSVVFERGLQLPESLACSLQALELARRTGDLALQAKACNNVGYDHAMLGDTRQGLTYCRLALDLYQVGDPSLEANTWDSLGYIYQQLCDYSEAFTSYQRAIGLFREAGAQYPAAQSLSRLGDAHHAVGDNQAARDAWQQALDILDALAHPGAMPIRNKLESVAMATFTGHDAPH